MTKLKQIYPEGTIQPKHVKVKVNKIPNRPKDLMIEYLDISNNKKYDGKMSPTSYMRVIRKKEMIDKLRKEFNIRRTQSDAESNNPILTPKIPKPKISSNYSVLVQDIPSPRRRINAIRKKIQPPVLKLPIKRRGSLPPIKKNKIKPLIKNKKEEEKSTEVKMLEQCSNYLIEEIERDSKKLFGDDYDYNFDESELPHVTLKLEDIDNDKYFLQKSEELLKEIEEFELTTKKLI